MASPITFTIDVEGTDFYIMPEFRAEFCNGTTPYCNIYRQDGTIFNHVYLSSLEFAIPVFTELSLLEKRTIQRYVKDNYTRLMDAFRKNKYLGI